MADIPLRIDGCEVVAEKGRTILQAAIEAGIYIPHLCAHRQISGLKDYILEERIYQGTTAIEGEHAGETVLEAKAKGCGLCKVFVEGKPDPVPACRMVIAEGMKVRTTGDDLTKARRMALKRLFAEHPHACLLCAQREGCSLTQCSTNVPEAERCCILLGHCELGKVSDFIGYPPDLPSYKRPEDAVVIRDPLFVRDYSLCISCLRCVRACKEIAGADILGAILKDDRFHVGTKKPGDMPEAECRFCGICVEICPTGALRDSEEAEIPRADSLPCVNGCPAGIDIPAYVRKIAEGDLNAARRIISGCVPLPGTLGHICFHPCEEHCRRGDLDEPVGICNLKRFLFEQGEYPPPPTPGPSTGKRVAIIGAGPAGLSAAWLLGARGHAVTLFDAADKPGGFLRQGIPRFRLPLDALERDLAFLDSLGIEFAGDRRMGDNLDPHVLRELGYDAVLLAIGTPLSSHINVENSELEGILWGLDFLRTSSSNCPLELDGPVIVIGGGGVALDTAMTALRSGAETVELVSLESEAEMPARKREIEQAKEEGVIFTCGWGPNRFIPDGENRLGSVELKRCKRVYDEEGHFSPEFAPGDLILREARWAILAVGQSADQSAFGPESGTVLGSRGLLPLEAESAETWLPGFFGAGDLVHGPSSVVEAIASGKRAATTIDRFLGGDGCFIQTDDEILFERLKEEKYNAAEVTLEKRHNPPSADPVERIEDFGLIEQTLDPVTASAEARRCLRCNLRTTIQPPVLPPEKWLPLTSSGLENAPRTEGVCIMADDRGKVLRIKGTTSIAELMTDWLSEWEENGIEGESRKVQWEEDTMFTKRESELLQQHLQEFGEMPGDGDDELDDLF